MLAINKVNSTINTFRQPKHALELKMSDFKIL